MAKFKPGDILFGEYLNNRVIICSVEKNRYRLKFFDGSTGLHEISFIDDILYKVGDLRKVNLRFLLKFK